MVEGGEVEGAGRWSKGGRERSERKDQSGLGTRWRVEGKRGMRRLPSEELAFTKHQNGTYRGPVISPYSLRTRIGRGDRILRVESHTRTAPVYLVKADGDTKNVRIITDTCFSRGASQPENSSSGKRVLFVTLLLTTGDEKRMGQRLVGRDSLDSKLLITEIRG